MLSADRSQIPKENIGRSLRLRVRVAAGRRRSGRIAVEALGDLFGHLQVLLSGLQSFLTESLQIVGTGMAEDGQMIGHGHVSGDLSVDVALVELGSLFLRELLRLGLQAASHDLLFELQELPRAAPLIHTSVLARIAIGVVRLAGNLAAGCVRIRVRR
jgi:hypothetical protein